MTGAQDGRGSPRPQGDHHAARQRPGHGDAAAGGRPDKHVEETGALISQDAARAAFACLVWTQQRATGQMACGTSDRGVACGKMSAVQLFFS